MNPYPHEPLLAEAAPRCDDPLREEGQRLRNALTALSPEERVAIETAFFSGVTYAETAERLGQPLGTIKTRIRSGLAKLRRRLGARER